MFSFQDFFRSFKTFCIMVYVTRDDNIIAVSSDLRPLTQNA